MPTETKRGSLEPWLFDWIKYYEHQVDGVRQLAKRRSFILADDMGLGKSLEALTVFAVDVVRGWAETMIVIAPPTLKGNWAFEIKKFTTFPAVVLDGDPIERIKQFFSYMMIKGPKILIMSYEQVHMHSEQLNGFMFDVAVFDEAHSIKNPLGVRTAAVLAIRSRRSFMLTGTPMENRVDELWCLLHRVDPDKYANYYSFINRHAQFGGFNGRQIIGVKNESELIEKVNKVMLRRLKKDVLDLPEVQILPRRVELHPEQRELYRQVDEDLLLQWADTDEPEAIEHAFSKVIRLRQICGTLTMFSGEDISSKLDLAIDDDRELLSLGEKMVVFTQFRHVQAAYADRAKKLDVPLYIINGDTPIPDRVPLSQEWGKIEGPAIFCAMQQVAYAGLNLTAARQVSFLDKHYNPKKNQQAIDRCHRIGASLEQPVQVREYLCINTIETRIEYLNRVKNKLFDQIINSGGIDWKKKLIEMLLEAGDEDD
jgi:SNF2 family DNA or RNA helicase